MDQSDETAKRQVIPFEPAEPRARIDGWSADKQRDFVEALADCGIIREAAARVGMSEKSVGRLRRRADGASFARACDAAKRLGAERLWSIAYERSIEGTVKRHYYHGELKAEERVFDNRLLIYLLGRLGSPAAPEMPTASAERGWNQLLDRLEHDDPPELEGEEIWEEEGAWWTAFPPPAGFEGLEEGRYGDPCYRRHLDHREVEALGAEEEAERLAWLRDQYKRRDRFFGFAGGAPGPEFFSLMEGEPSGPFDKTGHDDMAD
jgi:hypothetical protein